MQRRGFTLIELMLVIVIIGVLAAIAIPKLFGMNAKAKASEVGPAIGTWSKLAQVYYGETNSIGTWASIGYKAPGTPIVGTGKSATTNVLYEDPDFGAQPSLFHWQATARHISDLCDGQIWSAQSNGNTVDITGLGCPDLTPNFKNIK